MDADTMEVTMKLSMNAMKSSFLALALCAVAPSAHAAISVLGGATLSSDTSTTGGVAATTTGGWGYTGGVTYMKGFTPLFGIEVGALYGTQKVTLGVTGASIEVKSKALMIPALVHVTAIPFLDFGAGGYYSTLMGDVDVTTTVGGVSTATVLTPTSKGDYGALFTAGLSMPLAPMMSLGFEGWYALGLKNKSSTAGDSTKTREVLALLRLKLAIL